MVSLSGRQSQSSMTRRSRSSCGPILIGIGLMTVVCVVTFCGLVLAAEAMGIGSLSQLEEAAQYVLTYTGLVSMPPPPDLTFPDLGPSPTPFPPQPTGSVTDGRLPSPTATPTRTQIARFISSPTTVPRAAATASRTRTPTRTASPPPLPTASATSEIQPTEAGATAAPTIAPTVSTCDASVNASVEDQVIALINAKRMAQRLAAYSVDSRLTAAARVQGTDMACNHFTSHTGSDGSTVRDRVARQGYTWSWIGENYYAGHGGAQTAFDWWMNSTPHRNNLLSPNYTQFGVGYVYDADSDYGGYFVLVFAKPG
jgi:uncharacterized protein YkwD